MSAATISGLLAGWSGRDADERTLGEIERRLVELRAGRRRVYLFQSPLGFLQSSGSGSLGGVIKTNDINWKDPSDPNLGSALPKISKILFDIRCHVGVIIVSDLVCIDTSITLTEKLSKGKIFEHPGPLLKKTSDRKAKSAENRYVESFIALEFVGYTTKKDSELDDLLRDVMRVDRDLHQPPRYRPIFWNCHDIGIHFVFLLLEGSKNIKLVKEIAELFKVAKEEFQGAQKFSEVAVSAVGALGCGLTNVLTSGAGVVTFAGPIGWLAGASSALFIVGYGKVFLNQYRRSPWVDRTRWISDLQTRFPQLRELGDCY